MNEISNIYTFSDYRDYLNNILASEKQGRGSKLRLANYLGCQQSFISQVLSGKNELSLEYAFKVNQFLDHEISEADYFIILVHQGRAGSVELSNYFKEKMEDFRLHKLQVSNVVNKKELSKDDVLYYFSNFLCVSIHILVSISKYQNPEKLRKKLSVSEEKFRDAVHFLKRSGLVKEEKGLLKTGVAHIHLTKSSPFAQTASILTRLKVLEMMDLPDPNTINYMSNFTISKAGHIELKKKILEFVQGLDGLISKGTPEKFCTITLDLVEH